MKIRFILIAVCFLFSLPGQADEGMWMLGNLNKQTRQTMKELGLQMSVNKLYNTKRPSLKDAVVSFGGFCSGVVVSGGRAGVYQSSLRLQQHTATLVCGARLSERRLCGT